MEAWPPAATSFWAIDAPTSANASASATLAAGWGGAGLGSPVRCLRLRTLAVEERLRTLEKVLHWGSRGEDDWPPPCGLQNLVDSTVDPDPPRPLMHV